jgi:hypothetical protein
MLVRSCDKARIFSMPFLQYVRNGTLNNYHPLSMEAKPVFILSRNFLSLFVIGWVFELEAISVKIPII